MTATARQAELRRIVVTLGAPTASRAALTTAVRLAGSLGAEIEGVFIEDINLIQLAGLPFLRELSPCSLAEETISAQRIERQLRAMARQARTLLEQEARKLDVQCSFRVWRGRTGTEALTRAFASDILSLGLVSSLASCCLWARATPRLQPPAGRIASIGVLASLSAPATRAMTTAARLAQDLGASLTVFLPETGAEKVLRLEQKMHTLLELLEQPARFVPLGGSDVQLLVQAAITAGTGLIVMEAEHVLLQTGGLDRFQQARDNPVLLVR